MTQKPQIVTGIAVGASVSATGGGTVHLRLKAAKHVIAADMSATDARTLALKLLEFSADVQAMEGFRNLLFSDDLAEDRLPVGTVRKILHAMSAARFVQDPPNQVQSENKENGESDVQSDSVC